MLRSRFLYNCLSKFHIRSSLRHQQVRAGTGVWPSATARLPLPIAVVHLVSGEGGPVRVVPAAAAALERFLARVLPPVHVQFGPGGERLGARATPEHGRGRSEVRLQLCMGLEDELAHRALRAEGKIKDYVGYKYGMSSSVSACCQVISSKFQIWGRK